MGDMILKAMTALKQPCHATSDLSTQFQAVSNCESARSVSIHETTPERKSYHYLSSLQSSPQAQEQ